MIAISGILMVDKYLIDLQTRLCGCLYAYDLIDLCTCLFLLKICSFFEKKAITAKKSDQ